MYHEKEIICIAGHTHWLITLTISGLATFGTLQTSLAILMKCGAMKQDSEKKSLSTCFDLRSWLG